VKQHRIDRLLEARSLEPVPAEDAEVAAIWAAALREWADASASGLSVPGAFTHVYQAGLRAASAMLRAAGYRVRGAVGGHHHITFYTAGALGDSALEAIADAMQNLRAGGTRRFTGMKRNWSPRTWSTRGTRCRSCFAPSTAG
jgi:acetyl-CoA acetyltransferase